METTVNNGMCRCCASEGAFKDVKSTYHWMGEEEIYADMLRDCFDINLHVLEEGENGGICEVCITQLRNAINFKKQVLHTEEQFKKHIQNKSMFRPNIVKVEVHNEESDDNNASGDDAFSSEFEIPIKTEVSEEPKSKKRAAKASMTTRSKKSKVDSGETSTKHDEEREATTTEIKIEPITEPEAVTQEKKYVDQIIKINLQGKFKRSSKLEKHLHNLKIILECTNATTILRHGDKGYLCCYCTEGFLDPMNLKMHTLANHANEKNHIGNIRTTGLSSFLVKLDITNLKCMICSANIISLEELLTHLKEIHKKQIHTDIENHMFPFRFNTEQLTCCMCPNNVVFDTFRALHEHMHKHYRNYICVECDTGFIYQLGLTRHTVIHKKGTFACSYCPRILENLFQKRNHERRSHTHTDKMNKCQYCNEGFKDYALKVIHLSKVHGVCPRTFKCTACDKVYPTQRLLKVHVRAFHLMEKKNECPECDKAFFRAGVLRKHMLIHTGVKDFKCEVCLKCYAKKSTLNQHMRIHNNDRRFKCEICDQAFVQRTSYRWHMRAKHADADLANK